MQKETVRLTFDIPVDVHAHLKMVAAKKRISMRDYVLYSLVHEMEQEEKIELDNKAFKKELSKMTRSDAKLMKYLSDK